MKTAKVLFFSADPPSGEGSSAGKLQLGLEVREIKDKIRTARYRDHLDLDTHWAARPYDLLQALGETNPKVVHFSGHCGDDGLVFVGPDAFRGHCVDSSALAQLFELYRGDIRVVVLNACLSLPQAKAIAAVVGCAIGTRTGISDPAAITFSSSFYYAIASGKSVRAAFDYARTALALAHHSERDCLELVVRQGVNAEKLFVIEPVHDRRGWKQWGWAATGLVSATLVALKMAGGDGGGLPPACEWAVSPQALMAPSGPSLSAVGSGSSGVLSEIDRAKADYDARRYGAAFPRFRVLAAHGNPEAMGYVGMMFLRGHGTRLDSDSAIHWLRQAAYKRDPRAMTALGAAYQYGDGVDRSIPRAREWYHKAADEKHWAEAMRKLGVLARDDEDYQAALTWFQNAVRAGSRDALLDAGQLYEQGRGITPDSEAARCLYNKAAQAGSIPGMLIIGRIYQTDSLPGNDKDAAMWYWKAAAAGSPEGMYALAVLYQQGVGVRRDSAKADEWFERSRKAASRIAEANRVASGLP